MARPVYSIQIMSLAPALANNIVTVPDGARIIVRDLDAIELSGVTSSAVQFYNAAGGVLWASSRSASGIWQVAWRGRQVFNPGQSIRFQVVSGTWNVQISGYELTL